MQLLGVAGRGCMYAGMGYQAIIDYLVTCREYRVQPPLLAVVAYMYTVYITMHMQCAPLCVDRKQQ